MEYIDIITIQKIDNLWSSILLLNMEKNLCIIERISWLNKETGITTFLVGIVILIVDEILIGLKKKNNDCNDFYKHFSIICYYYFQFYFLIHKSNISKLEKRKILFTVPTSKIYFIKLCHSLPTFSIFSFKWILSLILLFNFPCSIS